MDYERLLNMAAEMGYEVMFSGAEIYRVEESMRRLLTAYGIENPEVIISRRSRRLQEIWTEI